MAQFLSEQNSTWTGFQRVESCAVMPVAMTSRFEQALMFAAQLHREQRRKGSSIPYVSHLLAVASLVIEHGGDEDEAIAALLHDAIEDQGGAKTREEIHRRFGGRVTAIVEGCTDSEIIPKPPWEERKRVYIARLRKAAAPVRLVIAADKLHNTRSILIDYRNLGEEIWQRFVTGKEGTLWYYQSVLDVLIQAGRTPLVDELDRVVSELERLARQASQTGQQGSDT